MPEHQFTTCETESEIWKPIPRFEGYYSVSNLGRVRRDKEQHNTFAGRIMKPRPERNGYLRIMLTMDGKRFRFGVHQLVALAFIGPCPEGHTVNHKDPKTGKTDNRADNLEYRTPQGQMDHAKEHGLLATGDRNGARKYPERLSHGDDHWMRKFPERVPRGATHNTRTHPERIARGERHGRFLHPERFSKGEDLSFAKLTEAIVQDIRIRYATGNISQQALADELRVNQTLISAIIRRIIWKHVP